MLRWEDECPAPTPRAAVWRHAVSMNAIEGAQEEGRKGAGTFDDIIVTRTKRVSFEQLQEIMRKWEESVHDYNSHDSSPKTPGLRTS